jgi:hypothetical protein
MGTTYGAPPAAAPACSNAGIPTVQPVPPKAFTQDHNWCNKLYRVGDPGAIVAKAVKRAQEMLDRSIEELSRLRAKVCNGEMQDWVQNIVQFTELGDWLMNRLGVCANDIRAWTAPSIRKSPAEGPTVAEVIRRLIRIRNMIANNEIFYACDLNNCSSEDTWAFVNVIHHFEGNVLVCDEQTPKEIIHLCRAFWYPKLRADGKPVDGWIQDEFRAQTIIHEASHLYHCTGDLSGSSTGVAECVAQLVAIMNNSPIDPDYRNRCRVSSQCKPSTAPLSGFGAPEPVKRLTQISVKFDATRAILPKQRSGARR